MRTGKNALTYAYLRLSREEAQRGESESIGNQRKIVQNYCDAKGLTIVQEFVDDGYSGSNFNRPGFQEMLSKLEDGKVTTVITKDLSRLGRDMRESSYYAEQFFPEHAIHYIAIADNFDTEHENIMAPFLFAMNEVYLRDGSRKIKDVLKMKKADGQYCCCPPYGYKKDERNKGHLVPDERTAPVVRHIFESAAKGDSCRAIAIALNEEQIIPPLKYRVMYRDNFGEMGAARASDLWNYTTVKRIVRNPVYLGHTILGKTKKVSIKSDKKVPVPKDDWMVTKNTHEPLVTERIYEMAALNLGKGSRQYQDYQCVRKSIFGGIAKCGLCGHSLCSCGTVYKGEREKYWYLSCTKQRQDIADSCAGVRIRYTDLMEVVKRDLNSFLDLNEEQIQSIVRAAVAKAGDPKELEFQKSQKEKAELRIKVIDKMINKLYLDHIEGRLEDSRLSRMVAELEKESDTLEKLVKSLENGKQAEETAENYERFFALARRYTHIEELDRETLLTFVDRIVVGPKIYPEGTIKATRKKLPYRQSIRIYYKFIGEVIDEPVRDLPVANEIIL